MAYPPKETIVAESARTKDLREGLRQAIRDLYALGFDLRSPGFLWRVKSEWLRLRDNNSRLSLELSSLEDLLHQFQSESNKGAGVTAPTHQPDPRLGSTTGDWQLPAWQEEPAETDLIDELNRRMFENLPGTGVRLPGNPAFDDDKGKDPTKPASEKESWESLKWIKESNRQLESYLINLHELLKELKRHNELWRQVDKVREQIEKEKAKLPNPEETDGNWVPKHPLDDPYTTRLRHPKTGNPLDDPDRGDGTSGPSNIPIVRGQATDPNPADDDDEPGGPKAIRTTGDAVTDPPKGFFARLFDFLFG